MYKKIILKKQRSNSKCKKIKQCKLMSILKLAFKSSPEETSEIFKRYIIVTKINSFKKLFEF